MTIWEVKNWTGLIFLHVLYNIFESLQKKKKFSKEVFLSHQPVNHEEDAQIYASLKFASWRKLRKEILRHSYQKNNVKYINL